MRAFMAIEPPAAVRSACASLIGRLRPSIHGVRWIPPENIHLTLRFLGEVEEEFVAGIHAPLSAAATTTAPFETTAKGLGCFPNARAPAVAWIGIHTMDPGLAALQGMVEQTAREAGLTPERRAFHPHLTIGRIREHGRVRGLETAVAEHADFEAGAWVVRDVALFASELHPSGARYHRLATFPLGTAYD